MALRQDRKEYSFKSVGNLYDQEILEKTVPTPKPIGFKTPLQLDNGTNFIKMHYNIEEQVRDNLRNLIMTNHGERVGRYDFGANILSLSLEMGAEEADQIAMIRIKKAVSKYMSFVELSSFATEVDRDSDKNVAKVIIFITYTVPRISNKEKGLRVTIYSGV